MKALALLSLVIIMGLSSAKNEDSLIYAFVSGVVSNEIEDKSGQNPPQEKLGLQIDVIAFSAPEGSKAATSPFSQRKWKAVKKIGNYVIPLDSWDKLKNGMPLPEKMFKISACSNQRKFFNDHSFDFNLYEKVIKVTNTGLGGFYSTNCDLSKATVSFESDSSAMLANIPEIYHKEFVSNSLKPFDCTTRQSDDEYQYRVTKRPNQASYFLYRTKANGKYYSNQIIQNVEEDKSFPFKEGKFYNIVIMNGIPVHLSNLMTYSINLDLGNRLTQIRVVSNSAEPKVIGYFIPMCNDGRILV